jgi:histidyl-tRNA synthetase
MNATLQRPKGTQDIVPPQSTAWLHLLDTLSTTLLQAGYAYAATPIFEATALFERGVGDSTDIVNKEMYSFVKEERSLTLRPEGTAGLVRAYIENGLHRAPKPVKLFYHGPMFRYERPQEGRQRQFHQLGAEVLGSDSPAVDAELIALALDALTSLGLQETLTLELNTVGDAADRPRFVEAFSALVQPQLPQLCADCNRRFTQNPLRMLDCKVPTCHSYYQSEAVEAFLTQFEWSPEATEHFDTLTELLRGLNVPFTINRRMVRGLDYYTRTVFELSSNALGAQSAVCGGGRYNGLVEALGGPATPAVGWAVGLERLANLLAKTQAPPQATPVGPTYYVATGASTASVVQALRIAKALRAQQHTTVEVDLSQKPLGKQLAQASKRGAVHALLLTEEEAAKGHALLKHLATGEQHTVGLAALHTGQVTRVENP